MASGKKNYFRHSFFAGNDDKIVNLIAEHGKAAYFHYFRLLELCGQQATDEVPEKFIFHRRTLCAELMVSNSKLSHHLSAMQSSLLLEYVLTVGKAEILVPNFSKFLGKYQTKNDSNYSNKKKRKEIKRKENKRKENTMSGCDQPDASFLIDDTKPEKKSTPKYDPLCSEMIEYLNNALGSNYRPNAAGNLKHLSARLKEGYTRDDFENVIDFKVYQWKDNLKMQQYLRPQTLFNSDKFPGYLEEVDKVIREQQAERELNEIRPK